jgi:antitoxin component of RelBE/YafQ-DinJ toxin-antitoxin module
MRGGAGVDKECGRRTVAGNMPTTSRDIQIDEQIKNEAAALFAKFGLTLSDGVKTLRRFVTERDIPATATAAATAEPAAAAATTTEPVRQRPKIEEPTQEEKRVALAELLAMAGPHHVYEKGFKFNRKECYDRKPIAETQRQKFKEFLAFAEGNLVFEKGYKFDREVCHER